LDRQHQRDFRAAFLLRRFRFPRPLLAGEAQLLYRTDRHADRGFWRHGVVSCDFWRSGRRSSGFQKSPLDGLLDSRDRLLSYWFIRAAILCPTSDLVAVGVFLRNLPDSAALGSLPLQALGRCNSAACFKGKFPLVWLLILLPVGKLRGAAGPYFASWAHR